MKKLFFTFLLIGLVVYYSMQKEVRLKDFRNPQKLLAKLTTSNKDLFFKPEDLKCSETCVVLTKDYDYEKISVEISNLYKVPVTVKVRLNLTQATSEKGNEFVVTLGPEQKRKLLTNVYPQNGPTEVKIHSEIDFNYGKLTGEYKNNFVYTPPILRGREVEVSAGHFSRNKPHTFLLRLKIAAGEVVQVPRAGIVVDIQKGDKSSSWLPPAFEDFSPYVVVQHEDGTLALYGNIRMRDFINVGEVVSKGQNIGEVRKSGEFFFEVYRINDEGEVDSFPAPIKNSDGQNLTSVMTGQVLKR